MRLEEGICQSVKGLEIRIGTVVACAGTSELIERCESRRREIPECAESEPVRVLKQQIYGPETGFRKSQQPVLFRACSMSDWLSPMAEAPKT